MRKQKLQAQKARRTWPGQLPSGSRTPAVVLGMDSQRRCISFVDSCN